jgi:hypothetical protein
MITLRDDELKKLQRLADQRALPVGTVAYEFVARALKRVK